MLTLKYVTNKFLLATQENELLCRIISNGEVFPVDIHS